jgi:uncharacterized protein (DUF58 family)
MAGGHRTDRTRLADIAGFIGLNGWVTALVGGPIALAFRSGTGLLFVLLLAATWLVLSLALSAAARRRSTEASARMGGRLTQWGLVYCAVMGVFCLLAAQWGINLFALTASFLLAGFACSAALALATMTCLRATWQLPARVFAGDLFPAVITLKNEKNLLASYALRISGSAVGSGLRHQEHNVWHLPAGAEISVTLNQSMSERGLHRPPPVTVCSGFPFGVTEVTLRAQHSRDLLVLPRLGRIDYEALARLKGGRAQWLPRLRRKDSEGDFGALREYRPGDDPRHIHWATSAKLRKLYVREFERTESHGVLLVLDAALPPASGAERTAWIERFEKAVRFTATIAAELTTRTIPYAFAACCPKPVALPYHSTSGHMFALLEALALAQPSPDVDTTALLRSLSRSDVRNGVCLVTPGPAPADIEATWPSPITALVVDVSAPSFSEVFHG